MSTTSRNRTLLFIITILLITNIAVVLYFFWFRNDSTKSNQSGRGGGMSTSLQKDVGFSESQMTEYKKIKDVHWKSMKSMFDSIQAAKNTLYEMVRSSDISDSAVQLALDNVSARQRMIETKAFVHFRDIRNICTPDQYPEFDTLLKKMINRKLRPKDDNDKKK